MVGPGRTATSTVDGHVVVDDHPVFRAGLVTILRDLPDVAVVGQAADGAEAIDAVARHRPDVVLMDLRMPRVGRLEATARITAEHPGVGSSCSPWTPTTTRCSPPCGPGARLPAQGDRR